MAEMNFDEFERLAENYNVIPVSKTLLADTLTPVSAYLRLRTNSAHSFLLESIEGGEKVARFSFLGRDPILNLSCKGTTTTIVEQGKSHTSTSNFFDILATVVSRYRQPSLPELPRFSGGLVGFIGYDAVRFIETIPALVSSELDVPDSMLALFTSVLVFDHYKHHITIIVNVLIDNKRNVREQYEGALNEIKKLATYLSNPEPPSGTFHACSEQQTAQTSHEIFKDNILTAQQYIRDGDIFQVVLSQRFSTPYSGDPFNVYRALRIINPSPYLYCLQFGEVVVIGSSPEILVRKEDALAEVYPIAGTRPRGTTDPEDRRLEAELLADEKERAEHVMLVDLGRNDLGRVCEMGTVNVEQLMSVVRYSHVMHIASRVTGTIAEGKSCIDVLKATFPAGTVSGAPKIRAMEIIEELETSRRGIYAGGVGYFDFSGNMDFCIAIRTMFATQEQIYFQAGAGIVADSDPEREYLETHHKVRALVEALRMAEEIGR